MSRHHPDGSLPLRKSHPAHIGLKWPTTARSAVATTAKNAKRPTIVITQAARAVSAPNEMSLRAPNEQPVSRDGRNAQATHTRRQSLEGDAAGGPPQPQRTPSRSNNNMPAWAQRAQQQGQQRRAPTEDNSDSDDDGSEMGEDGSSYTLLPKGILASVCIFGADGNLASKKILPTLFTLWKRKLVPRDILIFGYARADMDSEKFRKQVFRCIYNPTEAQTERKEFLKCCHYVGGQFDDEACISNLLVQMQAEELRRLNARPHGVELGEQVRTY